MTTRAQQQQILQPQMYNPAARRSWTETDWNWHIRKSIELQGFHTFHVREASETGVADLVVYQWCPDHDVQEIEAWLELKNEHNKRAYCMDPRKASQRQFMREHWREARNALYVMYDRQVDMLVVYQGDLLGRAKMYKPDPYLMKWQEVFAHFKARKVSL